MTYVKPQSKVFYISPAAGYVICKPLKEEKVGDIVISDNMKNKDSAGIVVAVGADFTIFEENHARLIKCPVKIGDKIIYANYGANRYLDFRSGEALHFVKFHYDPKYNEIIGIIEE